MNKKILIVILSVCIIFCLCACTDQTVYRNEDRGFSFLTDQDDIIEENPNNATLVNLDENIKVVIFSYDVIDEADPYYLTIYTVDELGMLSGAYESNYHNQVYVSQLFTYLFQDSEKQYTVFALDESTFSSYPAWTAEFVSADDSINGRIYLCVEHARSYIIIFYISDHYNNRHDYDRPIQFFTDSFEILLLNNEVD